MNKLDKFKTGYHYTSASNWKKIKKNGMIPYFLDIKTEGFFSKSKRVKGIFCWTQDLKGVSEAGSIIYQVATKNETKIVKLKLLYKDNEVLSIKNQTTKLFHSGTIGKWVYHINERAVILTKKINPNQISLVKEIDIIKKLTK